MSTPQAAPTSHAPQITTTSPLGHTAAVPNSPVAHTNMLAHPTAATPAPTSSAPTTTPSAVPNPVTPAPAASAEPESLSYNEQLNAADRLWKFKMALTLALFLVDIIGIGCVAWAISEGGRMTSDYGYGWDRSWALPWGLITFSISAVWCALCIILFIVRKRPVHPGLRVTMDLLLWLGFIFTALLTMVALFDVLYWGEDGTLGYSEGWNTRDGDYVLQRNNTWSWVQDTDYSGVTYERVCNGSSSNYYYSSGEPRFQNCAEMDAYVNLLWSEKPNRARVELTAVVCQWLGVVWHFALFVWACVNCHKYRRTKVSTDAEKLAAGIVQTMVQNGALVPPPGQGQMTPSWQHVYQPLPSQSNSFSGQGGYAMQGQYHPVAPQMGGQGMQQMYMRGQQPPVAGEQPPPLLPPRPEQTHAGPSNEKAPVPGVANSYYEPGR
ncbi:hypothetical protein C7974DRAFT_196106 [Boeremia exigua]|uniref:uncharacterized protein n=1 Tax=Boeremia exigua TaxID=749465 RepID=UPI001E8DD1CA|nr:uncharacterized protein C7974DRAFT_196106 [Boeremia exigua]KAH6625194.1 hypothetical protein C7974DRAFT_196106 [Boeremia exigua]